MSGVESSKPSTPQSHVQNDAAWPLFLFYETYRDQGTEPTGNATAALERAFDLAPQDESVRMALVNQYLDIKDRSLI